MPDEPKSIIDQLSSVQPMTGPTEGVFYIDFVRSDGPQEYVDGIEMIEADPNDPRYAEMVETFLASECPPESVSHGNPLPKVAENEMLHGYCYGGALSQRAGVYVTPLWESNRVLRYKGLWMS